MLARLWWKETRLFWLIWLTLGLTAAGAQWLGLRYFGPEVRQGALFGVAAGLAWIYAFAVAAATFAGEREHGTLLLLDTMGVDRQALWGSKFGFATISTFVLALALCGMAAMGTNHPADLLNRPSSMPIVIFTAALLFEAVAWGMFWSALSSNALAAAVLAILSVGLISPLTMVHIDIRALRMWEGTPLRLMLAAVATLGSAVIVTWNRPRRTSAADTQWYEDAGRVASARAAASRRGQGMPTTRRLAWLAARQNLRPAIGFLIISLLLTPMAAQARFNFTSLLGVLASLWLGVNAFGVENRGRTQRFLTSHGARPGVVWGVKLAVGALGVLLVLAPAVLFPSPGMMPRASRDWILAMATMTNVFAVAVLCGMTIRRGITAGVAAAAGSFAVNVPQAFLVATWLVPPEGLLITPVLLLAITWAWSADWMYDRPGFGRWARLGLLAVGSTVLLASVYVGYRVVSVPGPWLLATSAGGPPPAPVVPDDQNAALGYLAAHEQWQSQPLLSEGMADPSTVIAMGWSDEAAPLKTWLRDNARTLETIRRASMMPRCAFPPSRRSSRYPSPLAPGLYHLGQLLAVDSLERRSRGDLAGAWDDLATLIRMGRHLAQNAPLVQRHQAEQIEHLALTLAMDWAASPGQTPERLHAALDAFGQLPPMPPLSETIEAEWRLAEQHLDENHDDLKAAFLPKVSDTNPVFDNLLADVATAPWEVIRTRRVIRGICLAERADSALLPGARRFSAPTHRRAAEHDAMLRTTPLARWLIPSMDQAQKNADVSEVERRALPQVLAIRSWQLRHEGRLPGRLNDLVPGELDRVPTDPFAGDQAFRYVPLVRLAQEGAPEVPFDDRKLPPLRFSDGEHLLYSLGPNGRDDFGNQMRSWNQALDDIVFPIAPRPGDKNKDAPTALPGFLGPVRAG